MVTDCWQWQNVNFVRGGHGHTSKDHCSQCKRDAQLLKPKRKCARKILFFSWYPTMSLLLFLKTWSMYLSARIAGCNISKLSQIYRIRWSKYYWKVISIYSLSIRRDVRVTVRGRHQYLFQTGPTNATWSPHCCIFQPSWPFGHTHTPSLSLIYSFSRKLPTGSISFQSPKTWQTICITCLSVW